MSLALIGWTVVQSLWQWSLIGGATVLILGLVQDRSARRRHAICCVSLLLMIVTSVVTLIAAGVRVEPAFRAEALYAFDGAAIVPALVSSGRTILLVTGALWLAGLTIQLVRVARAWQRARDLTRAHRERIRSDLQTTVNELHESMNVRRQVTVWTSSGAAVPMVVGWRRPMILLPAAAVRELTDSQLRMVLVHELEHIRRRDDIVNLMQVFANALAFHHPAARWVSRKLRTEREYCCDDVAVGASGDAAGYARALALLDERRIDQPLAVAAASGTLLDRLVRIAGRSGARRSRFRAGTLGVTAILVAATLFALSANLPPPWLPAGVRLRRPAPPGQTIGPPMESQPRLKRRGPPES
jgi:beta-lactamase regulating signal transducer with metallopeptidase domain